MDMRGHKTKGMTRRGQTQEQKRNLTDESELKMIIGQNRAKWTEIVGRNMMRQFQMFSEVTRMKSMKL